MNQQELRARNPTLETCFEGGEYFEIDSRKSVLDGRFTAEELRAIADEMDGGLERAVIEAAINKRRCDLEAESLEAQRSAANDSQPDFPLLEKIVSAGASAYNAGVTLDESVDALVKAREGKE